MDEASSKYVDQLVLDKLVAEKLQKVHHYPTVPLNQIPTDIFHDFNSLNVNADISINNDNSLTLISPVKSRYPENQKSPIISFDVPEPRATILFMHGLFEENRDIYTFAFKGLNKAGYSIKLMTLPFHYERKPQQSVFSGEFFWSADILRTQNAFKQAVYEMYQTLLWLKQRTDKKVFIAGFSMGASVSLLMSTLYSLIDGLFIINPAASLSDIVWDSPLCRTVKSDYIEAGYSIEDLKSIYTCFEPISAANVSIDTDKIRMVYAIYDLVTNQNQYLSFISTWKIRNYLPYKAGHLNTLRVPRLADDIASFFDTLI